MEVRKAPHTPSPTPFSTHTFRVPSRRPDNKEVDVEQSSLFKIHRMSRSLDRVTSCECLVSHPVFFKQGPLNHSKTPKAFSLIREAV